MKNSFVYTIACKLEDGQILKDPHCNSALKLYECGNLSKQRYLLIYE